MIPCISSTTHLVFLAVSCNTHVRIRQAVEQHEFEQHSMHIEAVVADVSRHNSKACMHAALPGAQENAS